MEFFVYENVALADPDDCADLGPIDAEDFESALKAAREYWPTQALRIVLLEAGYPSRCYPAVNDEQVERFNKADANATYRAEIATTEALLRRLAAKLDQHRTKQAQDSKNWGYVGDLQHYNELLRHILGD